MSALDTVVSLYNSAKETLSNKVIDLASNTMTGTTAQFNTALSDGDFATQADLTALSSVTTATASTTAKRDAQANLVADAFVPTGTSTPTAGTTTTLTVDSTEVQIFTGSSAQTIVLPTTSIVAGQRFTIINKSTSVVTINASGGANIMAISGGVTATLTALIATPTVVADWGVVTGITANISQGASGNTLAQRDAFGNLKALCLIPGGTTTATAAGTTTMTSASTEIQIWTGATTQTITLPTTNIAQWQQYQFTNSSSGALTINSSAGNLVKTLAAGASTVITALQATPTTAAHWSAT